MHRLKYAAASALGVLAIVLVGAIILESRGQASEPTSPVLTYGVVASDETWEHLDRVTSPNLHFERLEPDEALRVIDDDLTGILVDASTIHSLGLDVLPGLYAGGRVVAAFGIEKQSLLRASRSSEAFPDLAQEFHPRVTVQPGADLGVYSDPFFTIIYRTRPGIGSVGGGETTQEFRPDIFTLSLVTKGNGSRGIVGEAGLPQ